MSSSVDKRLPARDEELVDEELRKVAEHCRDSLEHVIAAGRILRELRSKITRRGEWSRHLKRHNIGLRWAQYAIRSADVADEIGPRRDIGARLMRELTRFSPDELEEVARSPAPTAEAAARVRAGRRTAAQKRADEFRARAGKSLGQIENAVVDLRRLADDLLAADLGTRAEERAMNARAAAEAIVNAAQNGAEATSAAKDDVVECLSALLEAKALLRPPRRAGRKPGAAAETG